jgi:hypothetical protein
LGWSLAGALGLIPSFAWLVRVSNLYGLLPLALVAGTGIGIAVGATMGIATWVYLQVYRAKKTLS